MTHRTAADRTWKAAGYDGVELCGLRRNDTGGGAALVRIAKGARFPAHDHPGGEEVYVVSGRALIGGERFVAGDYFYTPPGGVHDLRAEEDTVIFVTTPNGVRIVE